MPETIDFDQGYRTSETNSIARWRFKAERWCYR